MKAKFANDLFEKILIELKQKYPDINDLKNQKIKDNSDVYLGRAEFCNINNYNYFEDLISKDFDNYQQLTTFMKFNNKEIVFVFDDEIKKDANEVISFIKKIGKRVILLYGDNKKNVELVANKLSINEFHYKQTTLDKANFLRNLMQEDRKFMMIGDGVNDAPALSLSTVSVSFNNASDLSKNIADILINSSQLLPLISLFKGCKKSFKLMKQNLILALIYNLVALPFAMIGMVVPVVAAVAMSTSSLIVILNSLSINKFFANKKI
jgi:Cu+-exporting ATPase